MLIDQMKIHPEEFRGYGAKFASLLDTATSAMQGTLRNIWMSQRDATAILAAAEEHLYEVWLAEDVLTRMLQPTEPLTEVAEQAYIAGMGMGRGRGKLVIGQVGPGGFPTLNNSITASTAQYLETAYQMEQKIQNARLERDNEYAMRITKPFSITKPFKDFT